MNHNHNLGELRRGSALVDMAEIYESEDMASFIDPNYCDNNTAMINVVSQASSGQIVTSDKSEKKSSIMSLFIKRDSS